LKDSIEKPVEPLVKEAKEVFWRHRRRYGSRRLHAELLAQDISIGRHKVKRVMKENGLKALRPKSFVPQTLIHGIY
jgi:putative transposase